MVLENVTLQSSRGPGFSFSLAVNKQVPRENFSSIPSIFSEALTKNTTYALFKVVQ